MKVIDLTRDGRLTVMVWSLVSDVVPLLALITFLTVIVRFWWPAGHEAQQLSILYYIALGVLFIWWTVVLAKLIVLGVRAFKGSVGKDGLNVDVVANSDTAADKLQDAGAALIDAGAAAKGEGQ